MARKLGFCFGQFRAADTRAGVLLDYQRLPEAAMALREADELCVESLGAFARESVDLTRAFYHLAVNEFEAAKTLSTRISPFDVCSRSRHALLAAALALRIEVQSGRLETARPILDHLDRAHADVLSFAGADQIALAIVEGKAALEGAASAREFARDFLETKRQELFPPPTLLLR